MGEQIGWSPSAGNTTAGAAFCVGDRGGVVRRVPTSAPVVAETGVDATTATAAVAVVAAVIVVVVVELVADLSIVTTSLPQALRGPNAGSEVVEETVSRVASSPGDATSGAVFDLLHVEGRLAKAEEAEEILHWPTVKGERGDVGLATLLVMAGVAFQRMRSPLLRMRVGRRRESGCEGLSLSVTRSGWTGWTGTEGRRCRRSARHSSGHPQEENRRPSEEQIHDEGRPMWMGLSPTSMMD